MADAPARRLSEKQWSALLARHEVLASSIRGNQAKLAEIRRQLEDELRARRADKEAANAENDSRYKKLEANVRKCMGDPDCLADLGACAEEEKLERAEEAAPARKATKKATKKAARKGRR